MPPRKKVKLASSRSSQNGMISNSNEVTKYGIQQFFSPLESSPPPQHHTNPSTAIPIISLPNPGDQNDAIAIEKEQVTPHSSKLVSQLPQPDALQRLAFSPGMLIKQSQDDGGGDEVTWKVSPVNQRLQSIRPCSVVSRKEKISTNALDSATNLHRCISATHSALHAAHQSPFTTPPSLSNPNIRHAINHDNDAVSQYLPHYHKKALIELLDQVGDALCAKESKLSETIDASDSKSLKNKGEVCDRLTDSPNFIETQTFLVLEVFEKHKTTISDGTELSYKVVRLLNEFKGEERVVNLWDEWYYSSISPGETVNVIGEFDDQGSCDVNRDINFIIVNPHLLISGTRVAASFNCSRRSVLDERLKSNEYSSAALIGTLLHQIFQAGLTEENPSVVFLENLSHELLRKNVESLYACEVNENDVMRTIADAIPKVLNWISQYKSASGSEDSIVDFGSEIGSKKLKICEVIDIEEMGRSPKYGLKGIIDASVKVNFNIDDDNVADCMLPLEIKTGKAPLGQASIEHCAQVILYTLLMSERYLTRIDFGLLCYLQSNETKGINVRRSDVVGLIIRRNELAREILKASTLQKLPPMIQNPNTCKSCRHLNVCAIYHKGDGGTSDSSGLGYTFDSLVGHLTEPHFSFLQSWERLIDLESRESLFERNQIRNQSGVEVSSSVSFVLDSSAGCAFQRSTESKYIYRFVQQVSPLASDEVTHHTDSFSDIYHNLKPGDYVILSNEWDHQIVSHGVVRDKSDSHVTVCLSKQLRLPGKDCLSQVKDVGPDVWRIDKDDVTTSFSVMRNNLVRLFLPTPHSSHLRKMIVDLEVPRFDSGCTISQDPAIAYIMSCKSLNDDQRRSIVKILSAKDYALILGMPGTGKTFTMVHAIKALLIRGASVLLTSYTNSAVDNLLIKLKAEGIDFLRIGRLEVIHEAIREHCFSAMNLNCVDEVKSRLHQVKVVGVTCLGGMTSPLLANKKFDVCIMDEAGQISLPISLGPLMVASRFVLVGDHYQLPPLVQSAVSRENGMDMSLFCKLCEFHPEAIFTLGIQYRMCQAIMELSNSLIYGSRLRCGTSEIANAQLQYTKCDFSLPWLREVLNPSKAVIFINTDQLDAYEVKELKSFINPTEVYLVIKIANELARMGIEPTDIGIATPYNSQANLIRSKLHEIPIEIHTIDKYQGRDKDCLLVSFVRSRVSPRNFVSSILCDWHRINVAITRPKKKLIMVGSSSTLSRVPLLKLLIQKVEELSGTVNLCKDDINNGID